MMELRTNKPIVTEGPIAIRVYTQKATDQAKTFRPTISELVEELRAASQISKDHYVLSDPRIVGELRGLAVEIDTALALASHAENSPDKKPREEASR